MLKPGPDGRKRCFGNQPGQIFYAEYHDNEWAKPTYDDQTLFEFLILEGAQAGLSWETVLRKRDGYRKAFHNFHLQKVADMSDSDLAKLQDNPNIIRNRLKISSARRNARVVIDIQKDHGSFSNWLWAHVDNTPIINHWHSVEDLPSETPLSNEISKQLKKLGMNFVGPTIIYAYMQAIGMVDDHLADCWLRSSG